MIRSAAWKVQVSLCSIANPDTLEIDFCYRDEDSHEDMLLLAVQALTERKIQQAKAQKHREPIVIGCYLPFHQCITMQAKMAMLLDKARTSQDDGISSFDSFMLTDVSLQHTMAKIAVRPSASNMILWWTLSCASCRLMRGLQGWIVPAEQEAVEWNHYATNTVSQVRRTSREELVLLKEMGQDSYAPSTEIYCVDSPDRPVSLAPTAPTPGWNNTTMETMLLLVRRVQDMPTLAYLECLPIAMGITKRLGDELLRRLFWHGLVDCSHGVLDDYLISEKWTLTPKGTKAARILATSADTRTCLTSVIFRLDVRDKPDDDSRSWCGRHALAAASAVLHVGLRSMILLTNRTSSCEFNLEDCSYIGFGFGSELCSRGRLWAAVGLLQALAQKLKSTRRPLSKGNTAFNQLGYAQDLSVSNGTMNLEDWIAQLHQASWSQHALKETSQTLDIIGPS